MQKSMKAMVAVHGVVVLPVACGLPAEKLVENSMAKRCVNSKRTATACSGTDLTHTEIRGGGHNMNDHTAQECHVVT